uniref:Uncharacterized protein n=1 Tax=Arcella intermedia TaxID=1963864 RepID=A0A6B2LVP1_9EUKA
MELVWRNRGISLAPPLAILLPSRLSLVREELTWRDWEIALAPSTASVLPFKLSLVRVVLINRA